MLAVGLTNILFDYAALPMAVKVFAQAISGAFIGMQIGRKDVARMRGLIVPFLLLAVMPVSYTHLNPINGFCSLRSAIRRHVICSTV